MTGERCCILYNQPRENALPDELDVLDQVEYIEKNLNDLQIETYRKGITVNFMSEVAELAANRPDFVFNLVESINNKGELCYFVPALLNMYSIPYSGNPVEAMFITTSKALTSQTLKKAGINNPGGYSPSQYDQLIPGNQYIIKPIWEDGSLGITGESVFIFTPEYREKLKFYKDTHWISLTEENSISVFWLVKTDLKLCQLQKWYFIILKAICLKLSISGLNGKRVHLNMRIQSGNFRARSSTLC
jgi:hypothetical protein